jgi:hypothetical protein
MLSTLALPYQTMTKLRFDHGKWHYELIEALGCSRTLRSYCNNTSAVHTHLQTDGRPRRITEEGKLVHIPKREAVKWVETTSESINIAFEAYSRQLVVVAVSVTEAALAEAFAALFATRPAMMKNLEGELAQPGLRLSVTLEELNAADDIEALRATVLDRAVSAAVQGKTKTLLKRVERLFGFAIDSSLATAYGELLEARNRIVHEHNRMVVSEDDIAELFNTGIAFVEFLARAAFAAKVPVDDPMGLFRDWTPIYDEQI